MKRQPIFKSAKIKKKSKKSLKKSLRKKLVTKSSRFKLSNNQSIKIQTPTYLQFQFHAYSNNSETI